MEEKWTLFECEECGEVEEVEVSASDIDDVRCECGGRMVYVDQQKGKEP